MKKNELLRLALTERGEHQVPDTRLGKYEKWTRKWRGLRREGFSLVEAKDKRLFWFISKRGFTLRYGLNSTTSRHVRDEVVEQLVEEGEFAYRTGRPARHNFSQPTKSPKPAPIEDLSNDKILDELMAAMDVQLPKLEETLGENTTNAP